MLYIGICDDEELFGEQLEEMLTALLKQREISYRIKQYRSGEALLKEIHHMNAVFLDIEMPGMDGIKVGEEIRKQAPNCVIIMVTSMVARYKEAFHIRAVSFVTKPVQQEELSRALEEIGKEMPGMQEIEVFRDRKPYRMQQRDIGYIRAYNGYVEFMIREECYRREESLNKLMELLDENLFARIHRRYVVNLGKVTKFGENAVWVGEQELPLSRREKKEFEQKYIRFDLNYR